MPPSPGSRHVVVVRVHLHGAPALVVGVIDRCARPSMDDWML